MPEEEERSILVYEYFKLEHRTAVSILGIKKGERKKMLVPTLGRTTKISK